MKKIYVFFLFVMMISCFFSCDSQLDSSVVTVTDGTEIIEISLSEDGFKYSVRNNTVSIHGIDENTLVKLIIPEEIEGLPVTRIASEAFYNMDNIIEVVLPSTIKEIGERAFNNCKKLEKINLPSGLERIESYAFGATACTAIWIPATVIYYGYGIFPSKLTYVEIEEGATIFPPLSGTKINEITIPSSIKIIPAYAFPSTITEVVLPEGLERIEKWAFLDCSNITTIKLPSTIKFLGSSCFSGVPITQLELPDGIEELESCCFSGTKIEELYIPKSVKKLGSLDVYWDDWGLKTYTLKKITFACDLTQDVINTDYPIIESPAMWLYDYPEEAYEGLSDDKIHNLKHRVELVFEDTVKTIAGIERSTFSGPFKSIDFGNGIERIEQGAFRVAVENVVLPPSLKYFGGDFGEVKNITIQSNFEYIIFDYYSPPLGGFGSGYLVDYDTGIYILEKDEYGWYEKIEAPFETITFTENVTTIPSGLFSGSEYSLTEIKKVSGSNIKSIGDYTFRYCDIEDFDAPMEEVGECAFYNAKLPANADLSKITKYGYESFYGTIFEGEVVINKDAEFLLAYDGYYDADMLTFRGSQIPYLAVNCNLPATSRGIFSGSTIENLFFGSDVTRIEINSFYQATISGTVDLNNVTYIGGGAFYECFDVEKFIFGHNPTTVKGVAFYSCNNAEFEFNGYVNLDMDSEFAFGNCYKLKNLPPFKPNTQITDNVFVNCVSIEELNLTNVYAFARAFGGCVNVERVVGLDSPIMEFDEENGIIYMNNDLDEKCYLVVAFNNLIPETFVIPSKVDVIASWSFAGLTNLKNISTDSEVVFLQSESFKDCTGLESFSLGYSQIGDNCFKGCTSLKNVTLNTQTIGSYAFADCTSLEKVTFTYSDTPKIGGYVFSGCTALKEIHDYMLWRGSGICDKNFWANCVNVEKYYAYYCSSASVWQSLSQKKSSLRSYGALSIFSDVIEYVDLSLDEWNAVTWN